MLLVAALALSLSSLSSSAPSLSLPPARSWSGASEALIVDDNDPFITPAERSRFTTTPSAAETRAFIDRLAAASPLVHLETFGQTAEGRDLVVVIVSSGAGKKLKPVVFAQAGIHAGEIDGKDAGLMLLRDIAVCDKRALVDDVDFVFVPIFNVDGHERTSTPHRAHQRGPDNKGQTTTSQHINLNRDYAKADSPEMQAMLPLLWRFDPALLIDLHVSDGPDIGADTTYTFAGWGTYARSPQITTWLQQRFRVDVDAALRRAGHTPADYPSFVDATDPTKGLRRSPEGPRYSTGYGDVVGIPTVLVENHMLKPYRQRVLGARVLLEQALRTVADDAAAVARAKAADSNARPTTFLVGWQRRAQPIASVALDVVVPPTRPSPITGRDELAYPQMPTAPTMTTLPVYGVDETQLVTLPKAWWLPPSEHEAIARLKLHGIRFETTTTARTLSLDEARFGPPSFGPVADGRIRTTATITHTTTSTTMPAGSIRVPADQPRRLLAAALLEPESSDSFFANGFFAHVFGGGGNDIEPWALSSWAEQRLKDDAALRTAFSKRLEDAAFATDPAARAQWFFDRSPWAASDVGVDPVKRER